MGDEDWRENGMCTGSETACGLSTCILAWWELKHKPRAAVGHHSLALNGPEKGRKDHRAGGSLELVLEIESLHNFSRQQGRRKNPELG